MASVMPGSQNWVDESNAYNLPTKKDSHKSALEDLEAEMKLLHWHKLANEAALKAALIRTKNMKEKDSHAPPRETLQEKASWMQQLIEEEQAKPLQVGKDFIKQYEEEEVANEAALTRQVDHHIQCLRNLRNSIEKRETIKARKAQFREFKASVEREKKAVLEGKKRADERFKVKKSSNQEEDEEANGKGVKGTLSTVIGSLDKLVELEKRISGLEQDNLHDRVKEGATVPQQKFERMKLAFTKKKSAPKPGVPGKPYYAVRIQKGGNGGVAARGGKRGIRGSTKGLGKQNMSRTVPSNAYGSKSRPAGGGVFGAPQRFNKTGGQTMVARGSGRSAVTARSKPSNVREKRDLQRVKKQNASVRSSLFGGKVRGTRGGAGASSGLKTKNVHMQQFHNLRKEHTKRNESIRSKGGTLGTSTTANVLGGGSLAGATGGKRNIGRIGTHRVGRGGRGVGAGRAGASKGRTTGNYNRSTGGATRVTNKASRYGASGGLQGKPKAASRSVPFRQTNKASTTGGGRSRFPNINNRNNNYSNSNTVGGSGFRAARNRTKATRKVW